MSGSPDRWALLQEAFASALEIGSKKDREEYLDRQLKDFPDLRKEVSEMLRAHGLPLEIEKRFAAEEGSEAGADDDLVGAKIGHYSITGLIGRGGMGAVYSGERQDEFHMRVAVKVLKRGTDTAAALTRFRTERQILAGLQHPNIARLFDGGATANGLPYFVMEYVDGKPLLEYAARLSIRQRLELFRSVCTAVQYAHQNLVVHRDLKPSNILVTGDGVVKLLDFGIAKLLDPTADVSAPPPTATGQRLMTPDYASPEQVRGESVTTSTDVYSLGAVLYELLTGKRAHQIATYSPEAIEKAICSEEPTTPSVIAKHLDRDLDNIVLMALRKERERRYPSVEALSEDIGRYLNGRPVSARSDTLLYRTGKYVRRNRVAVIASSVVAASLVVGFAVAVVQARRAESRFAQVRKLANTFLFSFHDKIQNLPGSTEARRFVVQTALEYLDSLAKEAGNDVQLKQELATAYLRVGEVQGNPRGPNLGLTKEALESYDKAIDLASQITRYDAEDRPALRLLAAAYTHRGDVMQSGGKANEAVAALEQAAVFADRLRRSGAPDPQDDRTYVEVANSLGDALIDDQPRRALEIYERGRDVMTQLVARENSVQNKLGLPTVYQRIGRVSHELGDPVAAVRNYGEAQRIEEELSQGDPNNARYRRDLSVIYTFLGNLNGNPRYFHLDDPKTALEYYKKATAIHEQLVLADPKNIQAAWDRALGALKISEVLRTVDPKESIRQAKLCFEQLKPLIEAAPNSFRNMRLQVNYLEGLGNALRFAGSHRESLEALSKSLEIANSVLKSTPDDLGAQESVLQLHTELADSYLAVRDVDAAGQHLRNASAMIDAILKDHPKDLYFLRDAADVEQSLGNLAAKRGDRDLSARHYQNSLGLWAKWRNLAADSPYVGSQTRRVQEAFERDKLHAETFR